MTNQPHRVARAFTLIESIIYVGLTAFLLVSVLGATYPILAGAERSSDRVTADGEMVFVTRKIAWALSSATAVTAPAQGGSGSTLTVTHPDGTLSFTNTNGVLYLTVNGGTPAALTATRAAFTNFSISHLAPAGSTPRALDVQFDVNGTTVGPIRLYARY